MALKPKLTTQAKKAGATTGNVWAFIPSNLDYKVPGLMFEAHMDSVAPTTGTKVVRKDGVLYSDGTTTLGGDDKVGIAASLEAVKVILAKQTAPRRYSAVFHHRRRNRQRRRKIYGPFMD